MVAKLPFSLQNSFIYEATRMLMLKNEICTCPLPPYSEMIQ